MNTSRMNRLEELGRVDAEKGFTKKGKRNLKDEKKRIVRELKNKGDEHLRILSEKGVSGIHLCGDDDLTEILSFCFTGFKIELLSLISEKKLIAKVKQNKEPKFPELKSGELILLASLEHQAPLAELLAQQGLQKNQHWVLFS